jgi:hypothetical protein
MEPKAFDALAISVADGNTSRRGLVARLGLGGLAASLAAAGIGVSRVERAAAASAFTCDFSIQANVRLGPSAGDILDGGTTPGQVSGLLSVGVDADGDIASGSLKLANGKKLVVVGQSEGRELNLRISTGGGRVLVGFGLGANLISDCKGGVDGLLTGPRPGDLGDWHAQAKGGTSGGSGDSGGAPTMAPATETPVPVVPTTTTVCMLVCSGGKVLDASACSCDCPLGQTDCSDICVDLQTDAANCGACGTACGAGQPCADGVCHCLYGPGTCLQGYVWREAASGDMVCVTSDVRDAAANDNAAASSRVDVNCQYGVDACQTGYVWRDAFTNDHVCVTGDVRDQAAADNAAASGRVDPAGAYGPDSCVSGYVWREANPTDHVCVTGDVRTQAANDNAAASSRVDVNCQYGVDACQTGYVWRDAFSGDHVCVTGDVRDQAAADNAAASSRVDPLCV